MTLSRNSAFILAALMACASSLWYGVKLHSAYPQPSYAAVDEQNTLLQTHLAQTSNPFALTDRSESDLSTAKSSSGDGREAAVLSGEISVSQALFDSDSSGCGLYCQQAIEVLKLPYEIADHDYEEYLSLAEQLAAYLRSNVQLSAEFIEIAEQAKGNKRKIIIAAFALLPEGDRLELGQALIKSNSEHHRLDGIQVLASTDSANLHWVNEFSELLLNEQNSYVRQSVVQALNRPEVFKGNAEVLNMLSQVIQTEGDALVRGEALLVSARLSSDPQSLLYDSFSAIRSEQVDYQQYGARAIEEIFIRHTRDGGQISEVDRNQLEQLVTDLVEPEFDSIPISVRRHIEDLFERFY